MKNYRFDSPGRKIGSVAAVAALALFTVLFTAIFMSKEEGALEAKDPRIEIRKSERLLIFFDGPAELRRYRIGLGREPVGDKQREGDGRTPEGEFRVFVKNPRSKYFLSLGLNYPSPKHAKAGLEADLIDPQQYEDILAAHRVKGAPPQKTGLGGEIYIHGNGGGSDWTRGCVALDDEAMREIFDASKPGMNVLILP